MSAPVSDLPEQQRIRSQPGQTWEERFPRYAANARVTATLSETYASRQRRAASMHDSAAANARSHDDAEGAELYGEMAAAALDAADALDDLAELARDVAAHYESKTAAAAGEQDPGYQVPGGNGGRS